MQYYSHGDSSPESKQFHANIAAIVSMTEVLSQYSFICQVNDAVKCVSGQ